MIKKINYISEISLPSTSAYSIHVMKMCNEFSKLNIDTTLYVLKKKKMKTSIKLTTVKKNLEL